MDEIIDQITDWWHDFTRSDHFERLTDYQQQESEYIVTTLAELLYTYDDIPPENWNERDIEWCCTQLYPAKVTDDEDHFRAVGPVLTTFFLFLADHGLLANADILADRVRDVDDDIVEAAKDPANWGLAKSMFIDAMESQGQSFKELDDIEEIEAMLQAAGATPIKLDEKDEAEEALPLLRDEVDNPRLLGLESEQRFLELYGHLLFYVNDRFNVIGDIETYADLEQHGMRELLPIRDQLYETTTEKVITDFIAENPADLSNEDLTQVEQWTNYEFGEFVVVRYLQNYAVLLDHENPPRAFGVKAVYQPFSAFWPEGDLPVLVSEVALLPFGGQIVSDGWMGFDMVRSLTFELTEGSDVDDMYEEAKHRFGIIESLPPPEEAEKSASEQLRFYMKNKRNREQYAEEIETLREQSAKLEAIYHEEIGKARARSLGRKLRELGLNETYIAIYDEQVIASGATEHQVREILKEIMPDGTENHPYIYHFDP
ncbi:hypothetical protein [Haladaptatus sp. NG-WS-4]